MSMSRLRLVSFDITNTLIRVKGSPGKQYAYIAQKFGIEVDENVLTDVFKTKYSQYCAKYPNFGMSVDMPANIWWSKLVKDCFKAIDSSLDKSALDKVANSLYFHYTTPLAWEFLPGAFDAIKDAKCKPEEAVHFGDNFEKDFVGAHNVGMESYLLASKDMKNGPLDQTFVVPNVQSFVSAIRPRLGTPQTS